MTLKKTDAALEELLAEDAGLQASMAELKRQRNRLHGTIKAIQKLQRSADGAKPRKPRKSRRKTAPASAE